MDSQIDAIIRPMAHEIVDLLYTLHPKWKMPFIDGSVRWKLLDFAVKELLETEEYTLRAIAWVKKADHKSPPPLDTIPL